MIGLYRAPLTKAIILACVVCSIYSASAATKGSLAPPLSVASRALVVEKGQWWRLASSLFASDSLAEGLLSWFLLYRFRMFERQMGSAKFAMFATLAGLWAVGLKALMLLSLPFLGGLASGPYELLFALFALYYALVPRLHPNYFALWRLRFSDKSFTYLLGLQLLVNSGLRSALPAFAGLLFGALFLAADIGSRLRFPGFCRRCCARTFSWWEAESPAERAARAQAQQAAREEAERRREAAEIAALMGQFGQQQQGGGGGVNPAARAAAAAAGRRGGGGRGGTGAAAGAIDPVALTNAMRAAMMAQAQAQAQAPHGGGGANLNAAAAAAAAVNDDHPLPMPEADPDAVSRLMVMGFGREEATAALRATFNNEEAAANRLLEGTS